MSNRAHVTPRPSLPPAIADWTSLADFTVICAADRLMPSRFASSAESITAAIAPASPAAIALTASRVASAAEMRTQRSIVMSPSVSTPWRDPAVLNQRKLSIFWSALVSVSR